MKTFSFLDYLDVHTWPNRPWSSTSIFIWDFMSVHKFMHLSSMLFQIVGKCNFLEILFNFVTSKNSALEEPPNTPFVFENQWKCPRLIAEGNQNYQCVDSGIFNPYFVDFFLSRTLIKTEQN